ncbi:MAG: flavodoxin [Chloroflexi bacterium]|nr:flavodoxin [Chloroflexota bacterium]
MNCRIVVSHEIITAAATEFTLHSQAPMDDVRWDSHGDTKDKEMRALVVYESIYGNTRDIAQAIGMGLGQGLSQFEVEVVEVGSAMGRAEELADLLAVGGPTMMWGMSRNMSRNVARKQAREQGSAPVSQGPGVREWLGLLDDVDGALAAAFDTRMRSRFPTGEAAGRIGSQLRKRGYSLALPPEGFFVTGTDGPLADGEFERAIAWGRELAAEAAPAIRDCELRRADATARGR